LELDTTICPINITSDVILRYARSTRSTSGNNIETLYNIIPGEVEASEFIIKENSPILNTPLSQLKFKENVLVASIYRDKKVIIPRGNDVIQSGDAVIIVSKTLGLSDVAEVLR
jgi:trk system potassium uptake protein TrkA